MAEVSYRVVVTREEGAWLAQASGLPGVQTWAKNLTNLNHAIREAIALAEDLPDGAEDGLDIAYEYHTGDAAVDELADRLRRDRARINAEARELEQKTANLARQLAGVAGFSLRDTAALLGVSPQRVSQVAPKKAA
jgi:hypothetical protein